MIKLSIIHRIIFFVFAITFIILAYFANRNVSNSVLLGFTFTFLLFTLLAGEVMVHESGFVTAMHYSAVIYEDHKNAEKEKK